MKKKSMIINFAIILLVTVFLICLILFVDKPENLINALKSMRVYWLVVAFSLMILYWIFEALTIYFISKKLYPEHRFKNSFKTVMIGQLFNCITPFATGGQPMQIYFLTQRGMPAGLATLALLSRFLVYQSVLTLYSAVVLIFRLKFFLEHISGFSALAVIGFMVNLFVVAALICFTFFPVFARKASKFLINFLSRIHIIKNREKAEDRAEKEINLFFSNSYGMKNYIKQIVAMAVITVLQLTAMFSIPYCICRGLGLDAISYANAISASSMIHMISSFVPLPGASGGAEGSFFLFFGFFFSESKYLATAVVLWRLITFYFPMVAGLCFTNRLYKVKNVLKGDESRQ